MLKKIITLFKLGRKVAKSDILKITSKFHEPPLAVKVLFKILSFSFSPKKYANLKEVDFVIGNKEKLEKETWTSLSTNSPVQVNNIFDNNKLKNASFNAAEGFGDIQILRTKFLLKFSEIIIFSMLFKDISSSTFVAGGRTIDNRITETNKKVVITHAHNGFELNACF